MIWVHSQFDYIGRQMAHCPLFGNPFRYEPVSLNGPAGAAMVAIVVCIRRARVILLVRWNYLLQLLSDKIILGPHFSFAASPAPIDHSGLLVTFPAFVVVP